MPFADANGVRLHYVDAGAGPVVVLIHGLGASHLDWEFQIPALSREFRVIAPDLRGYGQSERPPRGGYQIQGWAADVWALLAALKVSQCALVGHSMGGAVALQMALRKPGNVSRLVIANSVPSFRPRSLRERWEIWQRRMLMALFGPQRLARVMAQRMYPKPEQQALRDKVVARSAELDRAVYLGSIRGLTRWSVRKRLRWLTMPTLVIAAEHDYFARRDSEQFVAELPRGRLAFFAGARHGLQMEQPEAFNQAVLEFLKSAP